MGLPVIRGHTLDVGVSTLGLARRLQGARLARWREREEGGGAARCAPPAGACDPPIGKDDRMERGGSQGGMQPAPSASARRGKAGLCE